MDTYTETEPGVITIDFGAGVPKQEKREFTPVSEGDHIAVLEKLEPQTSQSGNPMLNAQFRILEGPDAGKRVWSYLTLQAGKTFRLNQLMLAVGATDLKGNQLSADDLVGEVQVSYLEWYNQPMIITVKHSEYNGKTKAEISNIRADDGTLDNVSYS